MNEQSIYLVGAVLLTLHLANLLWRRHRAREIGERWLAQHNYRVKRIRPVFWAGWSRFRMMPFRNSDYAIDFHAEVDDMRLGGTGEVRLRVWTDWLGMLDKEPEIAWLRMPNVDTGGALTPEMLWESAQMSVLQRAASGETTLRPDGRDPQAREDFDGVVEHILALQRRGLLHCATPMAELRSGAQYAEVADVVLTEDGRRALASREASQARAGPAPPN